VKVSRHRIGAATVLLAITASGCGEYLRDQGRSPSQVVVLRLEGARGSAVDDLGAPLASDVITNIIQPEPCSATTPCPTVFNDVGAVEMTLVLKDQGQPGISSTASPLNQVTFSRYRVTYRRADGRNTPGVDVPFGFDGGMTFTVPTDGSATFGFELVRSVAKNEAPLRALRGQPTVITAIGEVTFYGRDLVGNAVEASGSIQINFGDFGDVSS
jgi:hypothetical protein